MKVDIISLLNKIPKFYELYAVLINYTPCDFIDILLMQIEEFVLVELENSRSEVHTSPDREKSLPY